ncbi:MAG: enhanced serine sensitivity protein SseB [Oscillospiraceae bacterium]|jgi:hypothetical protein|nr:enhanced serine sensitivity protein SseB [Oscillospiraceae bacterium]
MTLEVLLKEAITTPEKRSVFLQTLIRSDVYVICVEDVKDTDKDGIHLKLKTIMNPEKKMFIPFFTSYKELLRFTQRYVSYYKINCLRLFDLIQSQNAVLNPNYYSKEFTSKEIQAILMVARNMNIPQITMNTAEEVTYTRPIGYYTDLKKAAIKLFQKHDNVNEAYLLNMNRSDGRTQLLIVVNMAGNSGKLFKEISKPLIKQIASHESLNFISTESPKIRKVVKDEIPFYVRKKKKYEK